MLRYHPGILSHAHPFLQTRQQLLAYAFAASKRRILRVLGSAGGWMLHKIPSAGNNSNQDSPVLTTLSCMARHVVQAAQRTQFSLNDCPTSLQIVTSRVIPRYTPHVCKIKIIGELFAVPDGRSQRLRSRGLQGSTRLSRPHLSSHHHLNPHSRRCDALRDHTHAL